MLTFDYETPRASRERGKAHNCLLTSLKAIAILLVTGGGTAWCIFRRVIN